MVWEQLRRNPWAIDAALVGFLLLFAAGWADRRDHGLAFSLPLALVQTLPLLARRRHPVIVFAIVVAATIALTLHFHSLNPLPAFLAFYSLAAHADRQTAVLAGLAGLAALVVPVLRETDYGFTPFAFHLLAFPAAWVLGDNLRTRRAYYAALEERAERLERERDEQAQRAVAEEQARIARELHDVLAHNVSVMVVQAAAARDVFDSRPARAREALRSIEQTGRSALQELRRLLGAVRTDGDGTLEPQPGLTRLPDLVDQVRRAGLDVELSIEGDPRPLAAGVDLAAYRVVQEALTNTIKHGHASSAGVRIRYTGDRVELLVTDDGVGPATNGSTGGHGLIGMRERVALYRGELETAARPEGGFLVRASLPAEHEAP
jgi:signal transduction histidine kinase